MKLIDASSAHQMFGRAGRPQYDDRGYVFAVAHEDDVRLHKWQEKYDQIPEDTKDPMLIRAKKNLKKKMPKRREGMQYWSERQFLSLRDAPAGAAGQSRSISVAAAGVADSPYGHGADGAGCDSSATAGSGGEGGVDA